MTEPGTPDVENLYARLGTGAPHLCFAGHTDVVPAGDEGALDAAAVRRRDRRRRALRPRRRRHEGRASPASLAAALGYLEGQRRPEARLALVPDHRRRGGAGHQRHAQGAGLDARRAARRSMPAWSASRPAPRRWATRSRSAGAATSTPSSTVHGKQGHAAYGAAGREPDPQARAHDRPAVLHAARCGHGELPAVQRAGHHRVGAEQRHQRHPGLGARQLQHPLQRPAHARRIEAWVQRALRGGGQGGGRALLAALRRHRQRVPDRAGAAGRDHARARCSAATGRDPGAHHQRRHVGCALHPGALPGGRARPAQRHGAPGRRARAGGRPRDADGDLPAVHREVLRAGHRLPVLRSG